MKDLQDNWIWVPNWVDSSDINTAGRLVHFTRSFELEGAPQKALLRFSADTRYKLYVNGRRVAVGPSRGNELIWYYDTLDIAPFLKQGQNELHFIVIRYFASSKSAFPFERTRIPGFTVTGKVETDFGPSVDLKSSQEWQAYVDESIQYPMGLVDDVFLHVRFLSCLPYLTKLD